MRVIFLVSELSAQLTEGGEGSAINVSPRVRLTGFVDT
jgi:hypothetical protein